MAAPFPKNELILKALGIYVQTAFPVSPPARVRAVLDAIDAHAGRLAECPALMKDPRSATPRYFIRLGNPFYPHMKLAIESPPGAGVYFFRVDTHDRHCCPAPGAREHEEFCRLMEQNQALAQQIEAAWESAGVPTFKSFLRADLARRQSAAPATPSVTGERPA